MNAFVVLCGRDLKRFVREPSRIYGALATPLLLWAFLAGGFGGLGGGGESDGSSVLVHTAIGASLAVSLFSTVFASIGMIQDRESGLLQSVLVSPTPRWVVLSARLLTGGVLAGLQGAVLLIGGWVLGGVGLAGGASALLLAVCVLVWASVGVVGMGLVFASRIGSVSGFHSVMSGVLLPLWALSGALFPPGGAAGWMGVVMVCNPMHWVHRCLTDVAGVGAAAPVWMWVGVMVWPWVLALLASWSYARSAKS